MRTIPETCADNVSERITSAVEWMKQQQRNGLSSFHSGIASSRRMMLLLFAKELFVHKRQVASALFVHERRRGAPLSQRGTTSTTRFLQHPPTLSDDQPSLILPSQPDKKISTVLAPMVAASDYPFRCLCRQYSDIDLVFTQMWHAKSVVEKPEFLKSHWDVFEVETTDDIQSTNLSVAQRNCLGGDDRLLVPPCDKSSSGPTVVQLAGHDVAMVTKAALLVTEKSHGKIAGIDLNLGCPQGIARRGRYGAFLMEEDPELVYSILRGLRRALPGHIAVSAKIRLPLDQTKQDERILRLRDTGINFLTIHGRDLKENKTKVRGIHVDRMRQIVDLANPLPVIANGGVEHASDIPNVLAQTGATAIMSSEAILELPHLLKSQNHDEIHAKTRFLKQMEVAESYIQWCRFSPPYPGVLGAESGSFCVVRGHLFKMLFRYLQEHRDLRDTLASNRCNNLRLAADLIASLRERYENVSDWNGLRSSSICSTWYRRHRHGEHAQNESFKQNVPEENVSVKLTIEQRKQQIRQRIKSMKSERLRSKV